MPEKKDERVFVTEPDGENLVYIHVTGDLMPCSVFQKILEHMQTYIKVKAIVFIAYNAAMMREIRNSFPSQYYERIELCGLSAIEQSVALRNAG